MPFFMIRENITNLKVDAIVCPTNKEPFIGGATELEIHNASGKDLLTDRIKYGTLKEGDMFMTEGYNLQSKHVIHVISPIYNENDSNALKRLSGTYTSILNYASKANIESIAFPLLASGTYLYPKDVAINAALDAIQPYLKVSDITVYLVVFDDESFRVSQTLYQDIQNFIDESLPNVMMYQRNMHEMNFSQVRYDSNESDIVGIVSKPKETFMKKLFKHIDELDLNEVEVYKRANIDRRLFSKMRSNLDYRPSKETALAFVFALKLNIRQARSLIRKAGYDLSEDINFDLIIRYCIEHEIYDIFMVNEILFNFEEKLLG